MIKSDKKDRAFWSNFYKDEKAPTNQSSFASFCINHIDQQSTLLELGCGNARDSFYFARNNIQVIAVDICDLIIAKNKEFGVPNVEFVHADFTKLDQNFLPQEIDNIYSRFTLHSVDKSGYKSTLNYCSNKLKKGGKLFMEARTINDPLYGKGTPCPDNGYIDTHYRRFFDMKETIQDVVHKGFKLNCAVEDYISSWYKSDHAVVFRIIAEKI